MKIIFWSNYPDSCVTSNMALMGVMISLMYRGRTLMMSNHYNQNNLGRVLLGSHYDNMVQEDCNYFAGGNDNTYIKQMLRRINRKNLAGSALEIIDDALYYYVQSQMFNSDVYDMRFQEEMKDTLDFFNRLVEFVFIDAKSQECITTKWLLDSADLVVVNLRHENNAIHNFFKRYSSLCGKCVFLLSAYQRNGVFTKKQFVREYKIHPDRVAIIPYHPEFQMEFTYGRIVDYICENYNCSKGSKQYVYMWYLKRAAVMLMNTINMRILMSGEGGGICADV